jgi:hypothetical protein
MGDKYEGQYTEAMGMIADASNRDAAASRELYQHLLEQMEGMHQDIRSRSDGLPHADLVRLSADATINIVKMITGLLDEAGSLRIVKIDQVAIKVFNALSAGLNPTQAGQGAAAAEAAAAAGQARPGS